MFNMSNLLQVFLSNEPIREEGIGQSLIVISWIIQAVVLPHGQLESVLKVLLLPRQTKFLVLAENAKRSALSYEKLITCH